MESYLHSIGCSDSDLDLYAMYLEDAGIYNSEDLMIKEPTMEELEAWGIVRDTDRECIYYACHPEEENPNGPIQYRAPRYVSGLGGFDAVEEAAMQQYLEEMEKETIVTGRPKQSVHSKSVPVDPAFAKARNLLEGNNTIEFIKMIDSMDVNLVDPNDKNTLLHWATSFNNVKAVQALIEKGVTQLPNKYGKTPVELAMDASEGGDSSFFIIRGVLAQHWKTIRGK